MWVVPSKSTPGLLFWRVLGGYFQARFGSAKPCSVTRRALMTHQILKEVSVGAVEPYISPGPSSRMDEYLIPQRRAPLKGTITHPAVGLGGRGAITQEAGAKQGVCVSVWRGVVHQVSGNKSVLFVLCVFYLVYSRKLLKLVLVQDHQEVLVQGGLDPFRAQKDVGSLPRAAAPQLPCF